MQRRIAFWFTVAVLILFWLVALHYNFSHSTMSVRFSWSGIPACAQISPAFELSDVPEGTDRLSFTMTDRDLPTFHHGGSTIKYAGNAVSQGAIKYTGPCPPRGERHTYRWTVQAIDAAGNILDTGTADAVFPP
jgi:phosphatidylethanolamine-binding protein (PEBP) family uncharacterized protein